MNNYSPVGYYPQTPPMYGNMPDYLMQMRAQQYQQSVHPPAAPGFVWVTNEQEARNYPVAPGMKQPLMHNSEMVMYIKEADASGKPTFKIFDVVERAENVSDSEYVTMAQFKKLVEYINEKLVSKEVSNNE